MSKTNIASKVKKYSSFRMHSNLQDQPFKLDCYLQSLLYMDLVTINQKENLLIHTLKKIKKKEPKKSTKGSHRCTRKEERNIG